MDFQELLQCTAFMVCVQTSFVHFDKLNNREDLGRDLAWRGMDGYFSASLGVGTLFFR